ncbi:MAG: AAA family ATPase [Candidatus Delongbacteria bacterium]|nr:AAA family ATPase [Candidatus Delongbacteria bacterium]
MKILSISLENFRQFYGNQTINFSENPQQPITVIHGENGSGKTALLNAFKWVLYGKTDFDAKKKLINERYLAETEENSEMSISVSLEFEHEESKYTAIRNQKFRKVDKLGQKEIGDSVVELTYFDTTGEFIKSHNASTHLKQIIPEDLHSYFFFNGERIDKLASDSSSDEIKIAIKKLLGLEILERADNHLNKYVVKALKKQLKDVSSSDLNEKLDEETDLKEEQDFLKTKLKTYRSNLNEFKKELSDINSVMEEKKEIAQMQKERLKLEERNTILNEDMQKLLKARRVYISNNGFLAFTEELINNAKEILEDKRKKGELPANIKQQFIKDLIENKTCICGRKIEPGSEALKSLTDFLDKSIPQEVEDVFIKTSAAVFGMEKSRKELFARIRDYQNQVSIISNEIKENQARIDVINDKIGKVKSEDIEKLNTRRTELQQNIELTNSEIYLINKRDLPDKEEKLNVLKKEIKEIRANNEKQLVAQKRLDQAKECQRMVAAIHDTISNQIRKELSERVDSVFSRIMRKDYWANIGEDYSLDIYKNVGDHKTKVFEKSTGENQVASLSFISSLISICKENYDSKKNKFLKGGVFPIVMDSPYGTLDSEYRSLVAKLIPELADQIIVMLSDSQWNGEVETELLPKVGKRYTLIYHTPHVKTTSTSKSVMKSDKYEFTQIKEGYYGR